MPPSPNSTNELLLQRAVFGRKSFMNLPDICCAKVLIYALSLLFRTNSPNRAKNDHGKGQVVEIVGVEAAFESKSLIYLA